MSVRKPLEALFAHLYEPAEPPVPRAETAAPAEPVPPAPVPAEPAPPPEGVGEDELDGEPVLEAVAPDEYELRIGDITAGLAQTLRGTKDAAQHLHVARQLALKHDLAQLAEFDLLHGREHRKTGLPPDKPLHALDASLLDTHGLLRARDLLKEVQDAAARRSAQPVGSRPDILADEVSSRPLPHFMLNTKAFDTQLETKQPLTATVRSLKVLREQSRAKQLNDKQSTRPRQMEAVPSPPQLSMEEQQENMKILLRMQAPLGFKRNPRHVLPPRKPAADAAPVPPSIPRRDAFIHVTPELVHFSNYEAGGIYEIAVVLQNVSTLSRRVRVLPPTTEFFSISLISYPSEEGHIAPGMHATMRVRFAPDSLGSYDDFFVVQTEVDSFPVPIRAHRTPPSLTLPSMLDCGYCFLGEKKTIDFSARNDGGPGRFYITEKEKWEAGDREIVDSVSTDAFKLTPTLLDLQPGDEFTLSVTFAPVVLTPTNATLLLVCDNCQIKELRVCGIGCAALLQLESIDGNAPNSHSLQQETVDFGEVGVFTKQSHTLRLLNTSPLPVDFVWDSYSIPDSALPLTRLPGDLTAAELRVAELGERCGDEKALARFPFTISPSRGALSPGEAAAFELAFEPQTEQLWAMAAMLRVLHIPEEAMPDSADMLEVGVRMLGRGVSCDLELFDENGARILALLLHGGSLVGKQVPVKLFLRNANDSARTFKWIPSRSDDIATHLQVELDPPQAEVAGNGELALELQLCALEIGMLRRTLHFECSPHGRPVELKIELLAVGPQLVVRSHVLDFGLLPLGDFGTQMLEIENLSELPASFMVLPAPLPRTEQARLAAEAQTSALGIEETQDLESLGERVGWGWTLDDVDVHRANEQLNMAFEPSGISISDCVRQVESGGVARVQVMLRAAAEQSLRRTLAIMVQHGETMHVNVRAEVVKRKACLSVTEMDLDTSYVRVAVHRAVMLTNLTLIPTRFAWHPLATQGTARVTCSPSEGILPPGKQLEIAIEIVPLEPGPLRMLVGCELQGGTAQPVGFKLKSEVCGLTVLYDVMSAEDPRLRDLKPETELPLDAHELRSGVIRPPSIDFGKANPIFEAKSMVIIMRNMSAVRTRFRLSPVTYCASELPLEMQEPPSLEDHSNTSSMLASLRRADVRTRREAETRERIEGEGHEGSEASRGRRRATESGGGMPRASKAPSVASNTARSAFSRPTLSNVHEQSQPFFSQTGVTFSAQRRLRRREAALLADRRGAAFEVVPSAGQLEPWGQVAITVTLHSNMWGCFNDKLRSEVAGLTPVELPLLASVVGLPLRLHDATLGLSVRTVPPSLTWAPAPIGGAPQAKTIRVENLGTHDATINWLVAKPLDPARQLAAKLTLQSGMPTLVEGAETSDAGVAENLIGNVIQEAIAQIEGPEVSLAVGPSSNYDCFEGTAPFSVHPLSAVIPMGGELSFQVAFAAPTVGHFEAVLVGSSIHPLEVLEPSGVSKSNRHPDLRLRLVGDTLEPRLELSERSKLKFKVSSIHSPDHPSYTRPLIMTNPSCTPLEFSLSIGAPFMLVEATASTAQFKLMGQKQVNEESRFVLPPKESLKAVISYVPSRRKRRPQPDSQMDEDDSRSVVSSTMTSRSEKNSIREAGDQDPHVMHRSTVEVPMKITFSNGTIQEFPLVATTTSPFLELSDTSLVFKRSHIDGDRELVLGLSNPTEADASWSIIHMPAPKPTLRTTKRLHTSTALETEAQPNDDPSVFIFSAEKGTIPAKGGNIPERVPLRVRFKPKAPGQYKSTFVFKVSNGISTSCTVSAEATLREEDLDVIPPEQHLRLLMPGMLS